MENKKLTKKEKTDIIVKYVKADIVNHMRKEDLRETLKKVFDIELKKSAKNEELANVIIKNCKNRKSYYLKIYEMWKYEYFGVSLTEVEETFNISRYKRKQLEEYYVLQVAYTYQTRAYGKYIDVPIYDLKDFLNLLGEDIDAIIKKERELAKRGSGKWKPNNT